MGAGQSQTANDAAPIPSSSTHTAGDTSQATAVDATKESKVKPPKNETGYARAQRVCRKKKRTYDACYTAQLSSKEEDCHDIFEEYRTCFLRVMAKDMEKRGVKVSENSMIGEYKDEVADEDEGR